MNLSARQSLAAVSAAGLELSYGTTSVLRGIDFSLPSGKTLALLGPSGCGKTTLLRLVAGLLAPTKGSISIANQLVADASGGVFLPPERRGLGMVFQDYALWPHMTVGGNVAFPLEMRGINRAECKARTLRALERVGLAAYASRRPSELSGGQQQRVAIARAIVAEPALILFDEPLSNLDRELRETMVDEIGSLISSLGLTAIYVTHDHGEALSLADQVAVMRAGRIEQLAEPDVLVDQPASAEVADFLRLGSVVAVERRDAAWWFVQGGVQIALAEGVPADATHALLPARAIEIAETSRFPIAGKVLRSQFRGDGHAATVLVGSPENHTELQLISRTRLRSGDHVGLRIDPQHIRWFSRHAYK
jgi:iron(III) transport system ATP-binding protein